MPLQQEFILISLQSAPMGGETCSVFCKLSLNIDSLIAFKLPDSSAFSTISKVSAR